MGFVQRRIIKLVLRFVTYPRTTLLVCGVLLAIAVTVAWTSLSLSTDHDALMTPKLKFFKDYLEFTHKFPENDCFLVAIEPVDQKHPPKALRWIALAEALAERLRGLKDTVQRVDARVPLDKLGDQGMLFASWREVRENSAEMQRELPLLKGVGEEPGLNPLMFLGTNMTQRLVGMLAQKPDETKEFLTLVATSLNAALRRPTEEWRRGKEIPDLAELNPKAEMDPSQSGYYVIPDEKDHSKRLMLVNVYDRRNFTKLSEVTKPLDEMREACTEVARGYPEFRVVVSGRPAVEADEMKSSDYDTRLAEIVGLTLVFVVLFIFLRSLWMVIAAEICLGVSIGWTFGWASLPWPVGRLNLLSLVFVIALIGIGMDYLIQILTRYRFEKKRYLRPQAVWARVFRFVGPPISTACAGAACAFFVSALTDFQGAAELGIIAGGGLLLCLATGYTILPALLTVFPPKVGRVAEDERYTNKDAPPRAGGWRLIVPAVWILVAAGGLYVALPPQFDPNLIKLQAEGLESVQMVHRLPTWSAVVLTDDLAKMRAVRDKVLARPQDGVPGAHVSTVARTDSLLDAIDKQKWLAQNNGVFRQIKWRVPGSVSDEDLGSISTALQDAVKTWKGEHVDAAALEEQVRGIEGVLASKDAGERLLVRARVEAWQKAFLTEMQAQVAQFIPSPLDIERLPPELRDHYVNYAPLETETSGTARVGGAGSVATGKPSRPTYALYIYPAQDLWKADELDAFVAELRGKITESPDVLLTGLAPQLQGSTQAIHKAFMQSTVYALVMIVFLVWLDLRKLSQTILAVSVLALGLPMLLLVMYLWRWTGVMLDHDPWGISGSWNFANFFGLPILIGAGHEYGVFMVHRYREVLHDPKRVWRTWDVSDRALLLCAIVTTCSFGFLMIADHRGLRSLGWVMAVGSACIYLSTLLVLRPILQWRLRQKDVYSSEK